MRIEIDHTLNLTVPPGFGQLVLHLLLTPASGPSQTVESWSVEVAGIGNAGRFRDGYGNAVHLVNQPRPEGEVAIAARGVVTTRDVNGILGRPAGEPVPALYKRVTAVTKAPTDLLDTLAGHKGRLDLLHGLMGRVGETLGLPPDAEATSQMQATGEQSQSQSSAAGSGERPAPRDYAHLFIGAARALDIPARYVFGYLAPGDGQAGGVHAWAEAFDDRLGWIGFDPWNQLCPTERYVRLAVGLDAESALPVRTVPMAEIAQKAGVTAS
jgi:transglutaminase-like putative cysteine protease